MDHNVTSIAAHAVVRDQVQQARLRALAVQGDLDLRYDWRRPGRTFHVENGYWEDVTDLLDALYGA